VNATGTVTVTECREVLAPDTPAAVTTEVGSIMIPIIINTMNVIQIEPIGNSFPIWLTATFANNVITISGKPTNEIEFFYQIRLIGSCGPTQMIEGLITVGPAEP
jgi:hypothetical protein